jgi:hypothetical protein
MGIAPSRSWLMGIAMGDPIGRVNLLDSKG